MRSAAVVAAINIACLSKGHELTHAFDSGGRLRIIYGPEYTVPENLEHQRQRGLSAKRSLAPREFALGGRGARAVCEE